MPENRLQYSEEAQDMMGKIPGWIIRWGITILFVIFLGIAIGCHFIRYPEKVTAPVVITTVNPPADLMARSTGRIDSIFIGSGQTVDRGDIVALLYNTADYKSVISVLDSLRATSGKQFPEIMDHRWIEREYPVGELQVYYANFRRTWLDYRHYIRTDNIETKKKLLKIQIAKNREYYQKQLKQQQILISDIRYEEKSFERDSVLYAKKILSTFDYEQAIRSKMQKENAKVGFDASLTNTELTIIQMQHQIEELSIQQDNEIAEYERQFSQNRQTLISEIEQWQNKYVIDAPIAGRVSLTRYWSNNQSVQAGERLATVVPSDSMQVIGRMAVSFAGFGRVEVGQTVNVKLNGFPYMEYGVLKGNITRISDVPDGEGYVAEVVFPNGMTTTYKKRLTLIQQMDGTGEIITKNLSLLQRFFQPLRALFDK